ncbi:MAG: hypothetical protein RJA70_2503 [Pseudomonadota bacterium]|jgi:uncharacterized alpha-E superfamily protein
MELQDSNAQTQTVLASSQSQSQTQRSAAPKRRMLSRVAEALYWSSRYVERAENVARFVDVNLNLMLETPISERPSWDPLVLTTGDQAWYQEHYGKVTPESVAWFLTFDKAYPNSILSAVSAARDNARTVREIISREMWQELNEFYLMVVDASKQPFSLGDMSDFYNRVKLSGIHYEGVTQATLSRGEAWHFAQVGRLLERADKTSRILDVKYYVLLPSLSDVGTTVDQVGWAALLNSASALQMYRQGYHVTTPDNVANFLLLNREFPRSILYCVEQAQLSLHALSGTSVNGSRIDAEHRLGQLGAQLGYAKIEDVMATGLHEYIDHLQLALNDVASSLQHEFFDYSK